MEPSFKFICCFNKFVATAPAPSLIPFEWQSICLSVSIEERSIEMVLDGNPLNVTITVKDNPRNIEGNGTLILGQDQDGAGMHFEVSESFSGYMSDLFIFSETLNIDMMRNWTKSIFRIPLTPLVSLDEQIKYFELFEVGKSTDIDGQVFFKSRYPLYHYFSYELPFKGAELLCNGLGGQIVIPRNEKENDELFEVLASEPEICNDTNYAESTIWIGIVKEDKIWQEYRTGKEIQYSYVHEGGQRGIEVMNCFAYYGCSAASSYWKKRWMVQRCQNRKAIVCHFEKFTYLRLRGLCSDTTLDTSYNLKDSLINPKLLGLTKSEIVFENHANGQLHWKIMNLGELVANLLLDSSSKCSYPIGQNKWRFYSNDCGLANKSVDLVITSCANYEFTCHDGTCISLNKRCDFEINCPDGSDEVSCDVLMPGYQVLTLPPPKEKSKLYFNVFINIVLNRIIQLDLDSFHMKTEMKIELSWRDSRMKFSNLRQTLSLNQVNLEGEEQPWMPKFELYGHDLTLSNSEERQRILRVDKISQPIPDNIARLSEGTLNLFHNTNILFSLINI